MVGVFYCIVYEVVYIIWESTVTFCIQYVGSLYEVVYFIPNTAYTKFLLYEILPHPNVCDKLECLYLQSFPVLTSVVG